jgi:hypothetical protein
MYLGRNPAVGTQKMLDSIESQFNGALATFDLRYGGVPTYPTLSESLIVSLGGVLQEPGEAYYVSSDKIVFSEAPATGTECWILLYSQYGAAVSSVPSLAIQTTGEPMGFENRTHSSISFNNGSRTFSIAPNTSGGYSSYAVWTKGTKRTISGTLSVQVGTSTGLYYIYFDAFGDLQYKTTYFTWDTETPVAYVYWNSATSSAPFVADERHGIVLDWATHEYLHRTRGAVIAEGFSISAYTTTGNGSANAHAQFDLGNGTFFDEDLEVNITHSASPTVGTFTQVLTGAAEIPVFYMSGSSGAWVRDTPTEYACKQSATTLQYNSLSGGTWSTAPADNNRYVVSWIVATNEINAPVIAILGQEQYTAIGTAEAVKFGNLTLTNFPIVEFRPLWKVIFQTSTGFTNIPNALIANVLDLRQLSETGEAGTVVSDHGLLSGLADDDHSQYFHTSLDRVGATANITTTGNLGSTNLTLTGELRGPSTLVIDPAAVGDNTGTVEIKGNLTVQGTTTTINSTTLTVDDKNIVLADGQSTLAGIDTAGIDFGSTTVRLRYNYNGGTNSGLSIEGTNVGIGTTNPGQLLELYGSNKLIKINSATDNSSIAIGQWDIANNRIESVNRPLYITTYTGNINLGPSNSQVLSITQSNNVGIGTTTPSYKLDVEGSQNVTSQISLWGRTIGQPQTLIEPGRIYATAAGLGPGDLLLQPTGGNIGIGTTSASERFHLHTANSGLSAIRLSGSAASQIPYDIRQGIVGVNNAGFSIYDVTAAATRFAIDSVGNIGVGVANPVAKLHVDGSIHQTWHDGRIGIFYDNDFRQGLTYSTSTRTLKIFSTSGDTGGNIAFYTRLGVGASDTDYGSEKLRITANGNVGIGITNPTYTLDVNGDIRAERYRAINSLILNSYQTVNPGSNVFLYSQPNDRDSWIYLDSADTGSNWGIYHRQIDSTVNDLPANSIGFIGGGNSQVKAYISLWSGNGYFSGNVGIGTTNPTAALHVIGGGTFTGQILSTQSNSTSTGAGQIYLNGATGNRIDFNQAGVAAPAFTTRSVGTKLVLYPELGASNVDYALGIESDTMWFSVPQTASRQFKWYAGTTNIATLTGAGNLTVTGEIQATLFRDYNDNNYYVNPAGANRLHTLRIFSNPTAEWDAIQISTDPVSGLIQGLGDEVGLKLRSEFGNIILADDRGNVGVGTTNPTSALHVIGSTQSSAGIRTLEQVRAIGWWNTPTGSSYNGLAVEMGVSSGDGYVLCHNRDSGNWGTLNIQGSGGSTNIQLPSTGSTISVTGSIASNGNITAAGAVYAAGTSGFYSSTFANNVRNPIWRFANADAYGLSYFQGGAGVSPAGGGDTLGFHFGTATAAASLLQLNAGWGAVVNGNFAATGNVGLGTTNPSAKLHIIGASILSNNTSIDPDSYPNSVVAGGIADGSGWGVTSAIGGNAGVGDSWALGHNGGALFFGMQNGSANDTMQTYIKLDPNRNLLLVPTSGNVGIGIENPNYKLHVVGTGSVIQRDLYISGNTSGNYGNRLVVGNTDTSFTLQDTNLRPTIQAHGAYPVLSLNHTITGNTSHGPTVQFTCNGTGNQFVIGTTGNGSRLDIGTASTGDWNPHNGIANHSGTTHMSFTTSGNVGVGTLNPTAKLVVDGGGPSSIAFRDDSIENHKRDSDSAAIVFNYYGLNGGTSRFRDVAIYNGKQGLISIFDGSTGNVGIGTEVPLQKLDVRGKFLLAADATTSTHITQVPYTINNGTLSWEGSAGQLFSITNNLTSGSIFSVNDISGLPSIDVDADGTIKLAPYGGTVVLKQVTETVANTFTTTLAPSSGTLTVDISLGTVILGDLNAPVITWAFTNVPTANSRATTITLIIDGDTAHTYGEACSVNGSAITGGVKWVGGNAPTPTVHFDIITFTIVRDSAGTIIVFGSGNTNLFT